MIERYLLRYFLSVTEQGNFSRAAAACRVTQPTLSVGIAKLEREVGHVLFRRTNRRVELTEAGVRLAGHARRIEASFAMADRDLADARTGETLRLGVLVTTPPHWIEDALRDRQADGADRIELIEARERDLLERLARGRIDVALTILRAGATRFEQQTLFSEGYSLAVPDTHPLAGRDVVAAEELITETMIVRRNCELLSETSRHFTARGVRPFFAARTTSETRALSYVRSGLGITVMPDGFVAPGVTRLALAEFGFRRDIGLIYAPHVDPSRLRGEAMMRGLIDALGRTASAEQPVRGRW